jgi:hypothetical protein
MPPRRILLTVVYRLAAGRHHAPLCATTSRLQCLQTLASALIHSAQFGHFTFRSSLAMPDTTYIRNASGPSRRPPITPPTTEKPRRCAADTPINAPSICYRVTRVQNKSESAAASGHRNKGTKHQRPESVANCA